MPDPQPEPEFLTLRVASSRPAAEGIQLFELQHRAGNALPGFTPGAHVCVRTPIGNLRHYSLCNDPADTSRYVIAVKCEPEGRGGSASMIQGVKEGDALEVSHPRNLFGLVESAPSYIFVAGGIGITPIRAMVHAAQTAQKPFKLFYLTRDPASTAFLQDLSGLGVIHHDEGDPARAFDLWPVLETPGKAHIYCCGPRTLMDAVRDMTGHWPSGQVHFEDFGTDLVRPRPDDCEFTIRLARTGTELQVPPGISILEAMRAAGLQVPSSCESGTCGTCRTVLLEGEPDHRDVVLSPAERAGAVMVCVSRARSGTLVLDA